MRSQSEDKNNQGKKNKENARRFNDSRRKLAKAGIISPIIMSLSSRPVWAINCTQSGMLSGNLSINYDESCNLPGLSREYYINEINAGRAICPPNSDVDVSLLDFDSVFNPAQLIFAVGTNLAQVLTGSAVVSDPSPFFCTTSGNSTEQNLQKNSYKIALKDAAAEAVAAYTNALVLPWYPTNAFSAEEVITKFNTASGIVSSPSSRQACSVLSFPDSGALASLVKEFSEKNNPFQI